MEVSNVVIDVDRAIRSSKKDSSAIRRPLNDLEVDLQLLSPKSGSLDTAHNDGTVFVDDTDFLTIRGPFHVGDHTLVPVVDHLLVPVTCAVTGTAHISIDFQF